MSKTDKIIVKGIKELPEEVIRSIYWHRLYDDKDVPCNKYMERFLFVVVDNVVYCSDDTFIQENVQKYLQYMQTDSLCAVRLPYVVIKNGLILKNRYGHTS